MSWDWIPSLPPIFTLLLGLIGIFLLYGLFRILFLRKTISQAFSKPNVSIETKDPNAKELSNKEKVGYILLALLTSAIFSATVIIVSFFRPSVIAKCNLGCIAIFIAGPIFWIIATLILWLPIYFLFKRLLNAK